MKKLLLGLGSIAAVAAPIAAVVSCGDEDGATPEPSTTDGLTKLEQSKLVNAEQKRVNLIDYTSTAAAQPGNVAPTGFKGLVEHSTSFKYVYVFKAPENHAKPDEANGLVTVTVTAKTPNTDVTDTSVANPKVTPDKRPIAAPATMVKPVTQAIHYKGTNTGTELSAAVVKYTASKTQADLNAVYLLIETGGPAPTITAPVVIKLTYTNDQLVMESSAASQLLAKITYTISAQQSIVTGNPLFTSVTTRSAFKDMDHTTLGSLDTSGSKQMSAVNVQLDKLVAALQGLTTIGTAPTGDGRTYFSASSAMDTVISSLITSKDLAVISEVSSTINEAAVHGVTGAKYYVDKTGNSMVFSKIVDSTNVEYLFTITI